MVGCKNNLIGMKIVKVSSEKIVIQGICWLLSSCSMLSKLLFSVWCIVLLAQYHFRIKVNTCHHHVLIVNWNIIQYWSYFYSKGQVAVRPFFIPQYFSKNFIWWESAFNTEWNRLSFFLQLWKKIFHEKFRVVVPHGNTKNFFFKFLF